MTSSYDFDSTYERRGTHSIKWEFIVRNGAIEPWDEAHPERGEEQILPLWVADMDFAAAPEIAQAIQARANHPVYGYASIPRGYRELVAGWQQRRNGWQANPDWVVPIPGIVPAMHLFVRQFTAPGDGVLIQRPVYHPFTFAAERNGREVVSASLKIENGRYVMDFDDLERKASDPNVKAALLCSPHNPVGRVWSADELNRYADICARNDVLVFADEIHGDLIMPGQIFVPYASVAAAQHGRFVVGTATSKTFNLAGLKLANLLIPDADVRAQMNDEVRASGLMGMNPLSITATEAAYTHGEPWLNACIDYIASNDVYLREFVAERMPKLGVIPLEGTYLVWLDFRAFGVDDESLADLLMNKARLYLDEGPIFGPEGSGFARINIACARVTLAQALARLAGALG
ncbi:MAG: MalY/PatB family protein [Pseudomonadota bacterium]